MLLPELPACVPQTQYRFLSFLAEKILSLMGWNIAGHFPQKSKFILAVAPHTSNWDFIISMLVMLALNLKVTFMGKSSIFIWPVKRLLIKLGGVAIERNHPNGIVGQMVSLFNERHSMVLGLSPEGTRSKTKEWKTGFLIIANKANVPIIPISLDFQKKEVEIYNEFYVDKDIKQALKEVKDIYAGVCAKNPHLV